MSEDNLDSRAIVQAIFRELVGERAEKLRGNVYNAESSQAVIKALQADYSKRSAQTIAHNLIDWNSDAAFIVAVQLFPERFTPEQIQDGVLSFLIHVPNHIGAAAVAGGHPMTDDFLEDDDED